LFEEITTAIEFLNDILPESEKLPPLKLVVTPSQRYPIIDQENSLSALTNDADSSGLNITPEKYEYHVVDKD
jgi:hypothetical protein